jgi:hypothetical protein
MKPKPFASLNHFTVPFAMSKTSFIKKSGGQPVTSFEMQDRTWQNQYCRHLDSNTRALFTLHYPHRQGVMKNIFWREKNFSPRAIEKGGLVVKYSA